MKKIFLLLTIVISSFIFLSSNVSASVIKPVNTLDASIKEITEKGFVSSNYLDVSGNLNEITISLDSNVMLFANNNTYTVSHTSKGYYVASYKIDVSSNKITKVHSPSVTLSIGTLSNQNLVKISDTKANLSFNQKVLIGTLNRNISSTISNGKISVTAS